MLRVLRVLLVLIEGSGVRVRADAESMVTPGLGDAGSRFFGTD